MKFFKILAPIIFLLIGVGIAALLIVTKKEIEPSPPEEKPVPVVVIEPERIDHRYSVESDGTVSPVTEIALSSQISGTVEWISPSLTDGAQFSAGEELIRINSDDFKLIVQKAEAAVSQAQSLLALEQSRADIARRDWEKLGGDQPASPLVLREPQMQEARARLAAATADLDQSQLNLQRCQIKAPFNGVVRNKLADTGQFIRPGEPLAQIYSSDTFEVRIPVKLDDLEFLPIALGNRFDASPIPESQLSVNLQGKIGNKMHAWKGRVTQLESDINPVSRVATLVVYIDAPLSNDHSAPAPAGLYVRAEISGNSAKNVLLLPRLALRNDSTVYVVDKDKKLQVRPIRIFQSLRDNVVVDSPLEEGDLVVTSVLGVVLPGQSASVITSDGENQ